jgi:NTE family protein
MQYMARVAVVLGAGGARGYAHLGAVQELRDRGHEIVAVSGTSMGALVGGLVAAGREQDFTSWVLSLTQARVIRMLDPARSGGGAVALNRLIRTLDEMVGDIVIEELPLPYTAVATDLFARREVWFQRGPLIPAIRASIAIPGLFTPATIAGRVLVDGGLLNPLPLDPTAAAEADFTIAVSLLGPREPHEATSPARGFSVRSAEWAADLRRRFARSDSGSETAPDGSPPESPEALDPPVNAQAHPDLRTVDVVAQSLDAMQTLVTRYRLAALPPDVLINVPANAAQILDFHRAAEMIDLGRRLASEALDDAGR